MDLDPTTCEKRARDLLEVMTRPLFKQAKDVLAKTNNMGSRPTLSRLRQNVAAQVRLITTEMKGLLTFVSLSLSLSHTAQKIFFPT